MAQPVNFREAAAGHLKPGSLYRTGQIAHLPQDWLNGLRQQGIGAFIDLRSSGELEDDLPERLRLAGVEYKRSSFPNNPLFRTLSSPDWQDYGRAYVEWLEADDAVPAALGAVGSAAAGGCLIGCHAGKDRTGILSAALSGLAGAPDQALRNCYETSRTFLVKSLDFFAPHWIKRGMDASTYAKRFACDPRAMDIALDHIARHYGSWREYALTKGSSSTEVDALCRRFAP